MKIVNVPGIRRLRLDRRKQTEWIEGTEFEGEVAASVVLPMLLRWAGYTRRKARVLAPVLSVRFCVEFFYARGRGAAWEITGEEFKRWLNQQALE